MKGKMRHLMIVTFILAVSCQGSKEDKEPAGEIIRKDIVLCPDSTCQTIDGFDVNITPAQWREGKLKPVIYKLVDDLGSTLIRFDCHGTADWLDPAHRYALWKNLFKNIEMSVFLSHSGEDLTIVGMSSIEKEVELAIDIDELDGRLSGKSISVYETTPDADCRKIYEGKVSGGTIIVPVPAKSIFTLTTLK